jgi:hypothetical protein
VFYKGKNGSGKNTFDNPIKKPISFKHLQKAGFALHFLLRTCWGWRAFGVWHNNCISRISVRLQSHQVSEGFLSASSIL